MGADDLHSHFSPEIDFFQKNKNAVYSIFPASRIFLLANWMASNVQLWRKQLNGIECTCSGFEENNCLHKVKCCLFAIFFQHFLQHLSTILLLKTNWRSFQYLFLETSRNRKPKKTSRNRQLKKTPCNRKPTKNNRMRQQKTKDFLQLHQICQL